MSGICQQKVSGVIHKNCNEYLVYSWFEQILYLGFYQVLFKRNFSVNPDGLFIYTLEDVSRFSAIPDTIQILLRKIQNRV